MLSQTCIARLRTRTRALVAGCALPCRTVHAMRVSHASHPLVLGTTRMVLRSCIAPSFPPHHPSTHDHHQGGCPFRCECGCDVWNPRVARVLRHEKRRLRCGALRRCFARCSRGRRRRPTTASCTCRCTTSRCVRSAARSSTTRSFRCTKDRWESSWTWSSCRMAT